MIDRVNYSGWGYKNFVREENNKIAVYFNRQATSPLLLSPQTAARRYRG